MTTRVIRIVIDSSGAKRGGKDVESALNRIDRASKKATGSAAGAATGAKQAIADTGKSAKKAAGETAGLNKSLNQFDVASKKATGAAGGTKRAVSDAGKSAKKAAGEAAGFNKSLGNMGKQARLVDDRLGGIKKSIAGLAIAAAAIQVIRLGDAWAALQGQLRLVTDSTSELENTTRALFDISQRTRQELGASADLYIRLGRATDFSNERILGLTETIGQTIALSRATPQAAQAALFQLGQGFAAGALRGEELNSVLEQTPELAKAIADGLGETTGGLRILGAEGKLTAELVAEALESSAERVNTEFADIPLTVGDAITKVGNSFQVFLGQVDESVSFTSSLAGALDVVASSITGLSILLSDDKGFGSAAGRIAKEIQELRKEASDLRNEAQSGFRSTGGLIGFATGNADTAIERLAEVEARIKRLSNIETQLITNKGLTDLEVLQKLARDTAAEFDKVTVSLANVFEADDERVKRFIGTFQNTQEKAIEQLEVLKEFIAKGIISAEDEARIRERLDNIINPLEEIKITVEKRELDDASQTLLDAAKNASDLRDQIEAFSEGGQKELDATIAFQRARDIIEETGEVAGVTADILADALRQENVLENELSELQAESKKAEKDIETFFDRARENSQDILGDFFANGFESIDDFEEAFAQMLLNLSSQALAAEVFNFTLGPPKNNDGTGGGGGFLQALVGAAGNFFGGAATGATLKTGDYGMVGEDGPEPFQAPRSGSIIPNPRTVSAAAPQVTVPVSVFNLRDPAEIPAAMQSSAGQQVILNTIRENPDILREVR